MSNFVFDSSLAGNYAIATGSGATAVPTRTIVLGFDEYEVVLAVTEDNRVRAVVEVRQKKDFRNAKQKIVSSGYVGMERFAAE
jgi:uncharacterized protein (DUF1330 family)